MKFWYWILHSCDAIVPTQSFHRQTETQTDRLTDIPNTWLNTRNSFFGGSCYNRCPGPPFAMMTHTHTHTPVKVWCSRSGILIPRTSHLTILLFAPCVSFLQAKLMTNGSVAEVVVLAAIVLLSTVAAHNAHQMHKVSRREQRSADIFVKWLENEKEVTENPAQRILPLWKIITLQHRICLNVFQIQQLYRQWIWYGNKFQCPINNPPDVQWFNLQV